MMYENFSVRRDTWREKRRYAKKCKLQTFKLSGVMIKTKIKGN